MMKLSIKACAVISVFLLHCCGALLYPAASCTGRPFAPKTCYRYNIRRRVRSKTCVQKAVGLATTSALVAGAYTLSRGNDLYTPEAGSLVGQTIVVTGASSGLGLETAKRLSSAGADMILTARTGAKGALAVATVNAYLEEKGAVYDGQSISYKVVDYDDLKGIKKVDWSDVNKVDVLVNNAGVMAIPERTLTADRIETQMQTNHLGPFVLTAMLSEKLTDTARIVNLSSSAHQIAGTTGGLDFDYLWKAQLGYSPWLWYGYSKLANIYFTQELQRRVDASAKQWTVTAVHPGVVATNLGRYSFSDASGIGSFLAGIAFRSPAEGASTQIWLASGKGKGGKYYADRKEQTNIPSDDSQARRLWDESEMLAGIKFSLDDATNSSKTE